MRRPRLALAVLCSIVAALLPGRAAFATHDVPIEPGPGTVALTFDDGPHPRWTPIVLAVLDKYDVRATFFVVGFRVERHPELVRAMMEAGHSVQNHSYGHENLPTLSNRWVEWSLDRGARTIVDAIGLQPACVRPPYGSTSDRVDAIARSMGQEPVIWDVNSKDYAHQSARIAMSLADTIEDGDVVLLHDTHGYVWASALPVLIERLVERGLGFDTLCVSSTPNHGGGQGPL